ncbi:MAG: hypothetical protein H6842_15290 [Rhodospirillaceae bacterium]|nr:hypothetical protein [Rhodospirillaceae bacterium]
MGTDRFDDGTVANPGPNGIWTAALVRARLAEAMDTLRRMKFPDHGAPPRLRSAMPVPPADWSAYGWERERARKAAPSPQAISRLDEAMPWLFWIACPRRRKAVCLRAIGLSWRRVARAVGVASPETARTWEADAVEQLAARLNAERRAVSGRGHPASLRS